MSVPGADPLDTWLAWDTHGCRVALCGIGKKFERVTAFCLKEWDAERMNYAKVTRREAARLPLYCREAMLRQHG